MKRNIFLVLVLILLISCNENKPKQEEKVMYSDLVPQDFLKRLKSAPIAYLPLGTLEWHGEHLPLGSDGLQSQTFMKLLAHKVGGIVLPMLFLGPDTMKIEKGQELYGMDFFMSKLGIKEYYPEQKLTGSAYWVPDSLFIQIIDNTFKLLTRQGFKIIVTHGHGPSTNYITKNRQRYEKKYGILIFNLWSWNGEGQFDEEADKHDQNGMGFMNDHAAKSETSLMMYLYPELVQMANLQNDTSKWPKAVGGLDPRLYASRENGKEIVDYHLKRMEKVLTEALKKIK